MHGLMTIYKKQQSLLENLINSSTFLVVGGMINEKGKKYV